MSITVAIVSFLFGGVVGVAFGYACGREDGEDAAARYFSEKYGKERRFHYGEW